MLASASPGEAAAGRCPDLVTGSAARLHPEGVAYAPDQHRFLVGSVTRKVIDRDGGINIHVIEAPHETSEKSITSNAAPAQPTDPGMPDWPAPQPFAPAGVPTSSGHGSTGNTGDSHLFAVMPWQDREADEIVPHSGKLRRFVRVD